MFPYRYTSHEEIMKLMGGIGNYEISTFILMCLGLIIMLTCIMSIIPLKILFFRYTKEQKEKKRKKKLLNKILLQKEIEDEVEKEIKRIETS